MYLKTIKKLTQLKIYLFNPHLFVRYRLPNSLQITILLMSTSTYRRALEKVAQTCYNLGYSMFEQLDISLGTPWIIL